MQVKVKFSTACTVAIDGVNAQDFSKGDTADVSVPLAEILKRGKKASIIKAAAEKPKGAVNRETR